ncbi:hypothetical protein FDO65_07760 [Nakamurella flava]|uniref:DUF3592 domain-containing protein n=1 Tax=Nakamurella flava TaxID=2576308 RepID=A0A4U6QN47_9ACTN|nr:hypothetical protein [Nakamurella flava]TKV61462.1 hypothetical protein FDO65_07760 [Nakamurella flava]
MQNSSVPSAGWSVEGLSSAVRSAGRGYSRAALLFLAVVLLIPVLLVLIVPAVAADAVGLTERIPAVVQVVDRQRLRDSSNKRPRWSVTVSWTGADGSPHEGSDIVTSAAAPYVVGQRVEIGVYGDDITMKKPGEAWWVLALAGAFTLIGLVVAAMFWWRSRAWSSLPRLVGVAEPQRMTVVGPGDRVRLRSSRFAPAHRGQVVPVRTGQPVDAESTVVMLEAPTAGGSTRPPAVGDQLDVWSNGRVAAVRRRVDGAWWVTGLGADGRSAAALTGPAASRSSVVGGSVLVLFGAIVLAGGRFALRQGFVAPGWGLSVLGLAGVLAGIVVLGRGRSRARRRQHVDRP